MLGYPGFQIKYTASMLLHLLGKWSAFARSWVGQQSYEGDRHIPNLKQLQAGT